MICARPGCGLVFCDDADSYPPDRPATPRRFCSPWCKKKAGGNGDVAGRKRRRRARKVCEEQGKQKLADEATALRTAEALLRSRGRVLYPYECVGHWHLTSKPPAAEERLTVARTLQGESV